MTHTKGGRGLRAPYQTTHVRVPVPIKDRVESLIESYKQSLDPNVVDPNFGGSVDQLLSAEDAIALAQSILVQKKSAKISLGKLLTAIYKQDIVL
jgi:hypothetical protein